MEGSNIEQILGSIKGHPNKENFLKLSKAIKIIAGSLDVIINDTKLSKNNKTMKKKTNNNHKISIK